MTKPSFVVVGLGFGDESKGATVDHLVHTTTDKKPIVVRYNGGPQCGHNVVTPEGLHHCFQQFGSGTFRPDCETHLSKFMLVNPLNLVGEWNHLIELGVDDPFARMTIAESAKIITPFQIALNKLREYARGDEAHGTCAQGVGETVQDSFKHPEMIITYGDLRNTSVVRDKLNFWLQTKRADAAEFGPRFPDDVQSVFDDPNLIDTILRVYTEVAKRVRCVSDDFVAAHAGERTLIFEGAQGVLLDEWYGFHPYTTWSTTTPENAFTLLDGFDRSSVFTIGCSRTYHTRHGAGPFPSEVSDWKNNSLIQTIGNSVEHNKTNDWQGNFRVGILDVPLLTYALRVCQKFGGIDSFAISHVDVSPNLYLSSYQFELPVSAQPDLIHQELLTKALYFPPGRWEFLPLGPSSVGHLFASLFTDDLQVNCIKSRGPTRKDRLLLSLSLGDALTGTTNPATL